jgi:hypothetical protein
LLPFDVDIVHVEVSKHFRNTWMRKWDWDQFDLREAIREGHKVLRAGPGKWELFVRKKGQKKLVMANEAGTDEVFVITGSEG